jgi:aspartyl-tRNA(Asn)/glutamyl-tRNA(Gln) amidotransferase subunit A
MSTDLPRTIADAAATLRAGVISAVELVSASLARADDCDNEVGSYLSRFDEHALEAARRADLDLAAGIDHGPLQGIPLGVKDIIATREGATSGQSEVFDRRTFEGFDAPTVARLRDAGAVITGKLTTMEFAVGFPDPEKPFPVPRNPWDLTRWAGGSSSGTGNAVAAGFVLGGLGTDTGGSIRIPSALCGITGHKPTFGLVPKSGCIPLGYTFDHIGPMARTARDCALLLDVLAGAHDSDPLCLDAPAPNAAAALTGEIRGLRIGVFRSHDIPGQTVDPDLPTVFDDAIAVLREAGAVLTDVTVPLFAELTDAAFIGFLAEAFAYHRADLQARWAAYGRATRLALATASLYTGADYVQAQRVRRAGIGAMHELFRDVDLVVLPTSLGPAPRLDAPRAVAAPFTSHPSVLPTPAFDALGIPALSVPMGFTRDALPLAVQIVGRAFDDASVLRAGDAFQRLTDWHTRVAPLTTSASPVPAPARTDTTHADQRDLDTVAALLRSAGLTASQAEVAALAAGYPVMREAAAALHAVTDGRDIAPVTRFVP